MFIIPKGELFIANLNGVHGHYEIIPPMFKKCVEIKNKIKCIGSNRMLENGLMYLN